MRILVVLTLPRDPRSVPLARRTIAAALTTAGVTRDCVAEVEVALTEACTNVLLHPGAVDGYEVTVNLEDEQLAIDVVEPGAALGDLTARSSKPAMPAEDGRGIALMEAFTDDSVFDSVSDGGGAVHLKKRPRWTAARAEVGRSHAVG